MEMGIWEWENNGMSLDWFEVDWIGLDWRGDWAGLNIQVQVKWVRVKTSPSTSGQVQRKR